MPRQPRLDGPGLLQHVMARGIDRSRIFRDRQDYEDFLSRLDTILTIARIRCYAWALLPSHFHLLLRSGNVPLSGLMRSLMTGYAVSFNRRHKRNGHLFQNRYKSIICEEEPYLLELVRYIHLNPLRARIVKGLRNLDDYPWTGHSALMGRRENGWQETVEVLGRFGARKGRAREKYRGFMEEAMDRGEALDFEGGGRARSAGAGEEEGSSEAYDERVLGGGRFVENVLKETKLPVAARKPRLPLPELIGKVSESFNVDVEDLVLGRRKREVSNVRALVSYLAVQKMGYRFTEVGEVLRVHPVSVARCLEKGREVFKGDAAGPIGSLIEGLTR